MMNLSSNIRHIFFDLDHTLWDFEENAKICLAQIYHTHQLEQMGVDDFDRFFSTFSEVNKAFWYLLDTKKITHEELRRERFRSTLSDMGIAISTEVSEAMNQQFLSLLPYQSLLIPHAKTILDALSPHFQLHILSNGYEQVQRQKLASGGILDYFQYVITNDMAQAHKPSPAMFTYAFITANCSPNEAVMVGDNWLADIEGAIQMGMPAIHYDPNQEACHASQFSRVSSLLHIPEILLT